MSPVIFKFVKFLDYPVDFGKKINNKPIFGQHKTYRGLFFGILVSIFIVFLQNIFYPKTQQISLLDYSASNFWVLGFLLGFGALFGDLAKSFLKRQFGILPGQPWVPFDQIDWIIGAIVFTYFYTSLKIADIALVIVIFGLLHPIANLLGFYLKIKKNRF